MTSPIQAIASGITAAAQAPATKRASVSEPSVGMAAHSMVASPVNSEPSTTIGNLPRASPTGPTASCDRP